jgi:hypothetical protein
MEQLIFSPCYRNSTICYNKHKKVCSVFGDSYELPSKLGGVKMEQNFKLILNELQKINGRLENLEVGQKKLQSDVVDVKNGQEKLQKNLIQNLGDYTKK